MGDAFKREFSLGQVDTGNTYDPSKDLPYGGGTATQLAPNATPVPDLDIGKGMSVPGNPPASTTITRPTFLSAFLQNLSPAISGAMSMPRGSGFAGGLGGGFRGIEEATDKQIARRHQQQQEDLQQQSLQLRQQQEAEQAQRSSQIFPEQLRQIKLSNDLQEGQVRFFSDPGQIGGAIKDATKSLGTLSTDEQARVDSAAKDAQITRKWDPIDRAVQKIASDRASADRKGSGGNKIQYDQGIPVSVTNKTGDTFDINDANMPAELKSLVQSAQNAHRQKIKETAEQQGRAFAQQAIMFQKHLDAPTQSTKTMIDTAPGVSKLADRVAANVQQQINKLGPKASRWNDFWTNKVGAPNPEFKELTVNTTLLRSLLVKMHIGSRSSDYLTQEFLHLIDSGKDSPENMLAAVSTIKSYADDIAAQAKDFGINRKEGKSTGRVIDLR